MQEMLRDGIGSENGTILAANLLSVNNHYGYVSETFITYFGNEELIFL